MRPKQKKPPYMVQILLDMPDGARKTVKLPSVTTYEIGARTTVNFVYKGRQVAVKLVRVPGGWDVEQ